MTNTEDEKLDTKRANSSLITPWFSIRNCEKAVTFYKLAFGATEVYRLETPGGGLVTKLSVNGAEFWLSGETVEQEIITSESLGGGSVRIILTVTDPDSFFKHALEAGAKQVFPVGEAHGWRLGRLEDPFGLHWEIGKEVGGLE